MEKFAKEGSKLLTRQGVLSTITAHKKTSFFDDEFFNYTRKTPNGKDKTKT